MSNFKVHLDLQKRGGIVTLFKHHSFTVDANIHKEWGNYDEYLRAYKLQISDCLYTDTGISDTVKEIIKEISENKEWLFTLKKNQCKRYNESGYTQYIYCDFDKALLEYIKRIFISTIVYAAKKRKLPNNERETIDFDFDTEAGTVTITAIHVYEPDDPYFEYARNAVYTLSVESIGIGDYAMGEEKVKDFYNWNGISGWKKRNGLIDKDGDKSLDQKCGIYMLYDANTNKFYVGKAKNLRERIIQHAKNAAGNDPIPNFTHYRYSLINMEYYEFLYLIENAAIHDCAMLIEMPQAAKLNKPLKPSKSLNDCKIVNKHERQRKVEK